MTFSAYIRLLLENFQYMLLCSISEVYRFDFTIKNRKISSSIAYSFIVAYALFFLFILYQFRATNIMIRRQHYSYSEELFSGLKDSNKARSYTILFTSRRLALCILLLVFQQVHFIMRVMFFVIIQIPYLMIII